MRRVARGRSRPRACSTQCVRGRSLTALGSHRYARGGNDISPARRRALRAFARARSSHLLLLRLGPRFPAPRVRARPVGTDGQSETFPPRGGRDADESAEGGRKGMIVARRSERGKMEARSSRRIDSLHLESPRSSGRNPCDARCTLGDHQRTTGDVSSSSHARTRMSRMLDRGKSNARTESAGRFRYLMAPRNTHSIERFSAGDTRELRGGGRR